MPEHLFRQKFEELHKELRTAVALSDYQQATECRRQIELLMWSQRYYDNQKHCANG